ncbi:MAG TPA: GNAT family N-acetyltransferase [Rhabdochlamydiaceae bacterium]
MPEQPASQQAFKFGHLRADARTRRSGLSREEINSAVKRIAQQELYLLSKDRYLTKEYYEKSSLPDDVLHLENALLVTAGKQIIGFLMAQILQQDTNEELIISNYYIISLAIDSHFKKSGLGTQLLLTAMSKAHALKMPLELAYYAGGDELPEKIRAAFYESFTPKFGIPMHLMDEEGDCIAAWNLEGIDELGK